MEESTIEWTCWVRLLFELIIEAKLSTRHTLTEEKGVKKLTLSFRIYGRGGVQGEVYADMIMVTLSFVERWLTRLEP